MRSGLSETVTVNPIRKVVTMLQNMQSKIQAEGAKKKNMFDTYMCYCENADETLGKSIRDAEAKIPQLEALLKGGGATMDQLKADIEAAKTDRAAAKEAIGKAAAIREKEAAEF